jgi:polysaccharide export outer membrane protein
MMSCNKLNSERTTGAPKLNVLREQRSADVGDSLTQSRAGGCRRQVRAAFAGILLVACVAGCAWSPGMSYDGPTGTAGPAQVDVANVPSVGTVHATAGAHPAKGADAPPAGTLVEITDDLVEKERAERSKSVPADVTDLFAKPAPYTLGPGDILSIVVWDHPELNMPGAAGSAGPEANSSDSMTSGYTVDAGGRIQYAYIGPL